MSTKKRALLTYIFYSMQSQLTMMVGFTVLLNGIFAVLAYFSQVYYDFLLWLPMTLSIFLIVAGHRPRREKWDKYAMSLPITSKEMIQADFLWILYISILVVFMTLILFFSLILSEKYEFEFESMCSFLSILFYYSVLPKIHELEKYLKKYGNKDRFSYIEGFFLAIVVHIAFFFASMIPLGLLGNEGIAFALMLSLATLSITFESYKKCLKYAENIEF